MKWLRQEDRQFVAKKENPMLTRTRSAREASTGTTVPYYFSLSNKNSARPSMQFIIVPLILSWVGSKDSITFHFVSEKAQPGYQITMATAHA
jgi:hypothetical protein